MSSRRSGCPTGSAGRRTDEAIAVLKQAAPAPAACGSGAQRRRRAARRSIRRRVAPCRIALQAVAAPPDPAAARGSATRRALRGRGEGATTRRKLVRGIAHRRRQGPSGRSRSDRGDGRRARAGGRLSPDRRDAGRERERAAREPRTWSRARGASRRSGMRELDFAYVGLGVHEEVVYSVAEELGSLRRRGSARSIRDGVRWDDERLRHAAAVGLGRTLLTAFACLPGRPGRCSASTLGASAVLADGARRALGRLRAAWPQGGRTPRSWRRAASRSIHPPRPRSRPRQRHRGRAYAPRATTDEHIRLLE